MSKLPLDQFPLISQTGQRFALVYPTEAEIPSFANEAARGSNLRSLEVDQTTLAIRIYRDHIGNDADAASLMARYGRPDNAAALAREAMTKTPVQAAERYLAVETTLRKARGVPKETSPEKPSAGDLAKGAGMTAASAMSGSYASVFLARAHEWQELVQLGAMSQGDVNANIAITAGFTGLAIGAALVAAPAVKKSLQHYFQKSSDVQQDRPLVAKYPFGVRVDPENAAAKEELLKLSRRSTPADFQGMMTIQEAYLRRTVAQEMSATIQRLGISAKDAREYNVVDIREVAQQRELEVAAGAEARTAERQIVAAANLIQEVAAERGVKVAPIDVARAHRESLSSIADLELYEAHRKQGRNQPGFTFSNETSYETREQILAFLEDSRRPAPAVQPERDPARIASLSALIETSVPSLER